VLLKNKEKFPSCKICVRLKPILRLAACALHIADFCDDGYQYFFLRIMPAAEDIALHVYNNGLGRVRRGRRVAGAELRHLAGLPGGGGD